jgi:hypothetical protein
VAEVVAPLEKILGQAVMAEAVLVTGALQLLIQEAVAVAERLLLMVVLGGQA